MVLHSIASYGMALTKEEAKRVAGTEGDKWTGAVGNTEQRSSLRKHSIGKFALFS